MKKHFITFVLITFILLFSATQLMARSYTIKSGDSLWTISQETGVSIEEIMELNDLENVNTIHVGQKLRTAEENENHNTNKGNINYTVKSGDLLWRIAEEHGVTIQEIIEFNNLESPYFYIYVGQTLIIPGEEEINEPVNNYFTYTIKAGDILWNIAQEFDTTVKELIETNDIKNSFDLYVGRELKIPLNENNTEPVDEDANDNRNREENNDRKYVPYIFHTVNDGEKIRKIANNYGINFRILMRANNLKRPKDLEDGDILIVPLNRSKRNLNSIIKNSKRVNNTYRVLDNETLEDIANFYGIPEEGIRAINDMTANEEVYTGQRLLMPVNPAHFNKHKMYRVASGGEYIFDIAYDNGISIRSILKANYLKDNNARFEEGTPLLIPLDNSSQATWIDYENGKPVNLWFGNNS
ncbi:MAG: LysM peptidoglycan-binding domain-containing protein [bacterium]